MDTKTLQQKIQKCLDCGDDVDYNGEGEAYPWFNKTEAAIELEKLISEQSKIVAVAFQEYIDRFRIEESRYAKQYSDKHGMVTWRGRSVEDVYDDFIARKPIKSCMLLVESVWGYNEKGHLEYVMPPKQ